MADRIVEVASGYSDSDVDVTLGCSHRMRSNSHAFDEQEGITFHEHAIGVSTAVALVRVRTDELQGAWRILDGVPLDAGGEACASAATQAATSNFLDDVVGRHAQRASQSDHSAMVLIPDHG